MRSVKIFFNAIVILIIQHKALSQNCSNLNIAYQADINSTCNNMVMTMKHDVLNRHFLYVANKEGGLKIYDIAVIAAPSLIAIVPTTLFDTLDVMNVEQDGNYLYLSLGNSFTNPQKCGIAIINVTNPFVPKVTDYFIVPGSNSGAGIVKVEGGYAYLGAMQSGLIILDISDKNTIQFVSQFIPDINFPVSGPNPDFYNARGMEVNNGIVYLCYDAGGIRIINCTNKLTPVETGRWCNPIMYNPFNLPRAYNNIIVDDTLAYVTVDYCGLEVLNISDTANISLQGWWNPYNCPNNNWFSSPSHTNEIQYDKNCKHIFLSTGKSDMIVVDVTNPSQPDSCNFYGGVSNNLGTWGIGLYQDQLYLSYICAVVPFYSNWTGVKILTYNSCAASIGEEACNTMKYFPNPAKDKITIISKPGADMKDIKLINPLGQFYSVPYVKSADEVNVDVSSLNNGLYFLYLFIGDERAMHKVIIDK